MAAPHISTDELAAAKRAARTRALALRRGLDPAAGERLAAQLLRACAPPSGAVVGGYWPLADELDIRTLLAELYARGHPIALPVTPKRGEALHFRRWEPGQEMTRERFGTLAPTGPALVPGFLLVPLLAFDRTGARLGYGAGYYDRTLAGLPGAVAIGCAWAALEVPRVPTGPEDVRLDAVATEDGVVSRRGGE